MKLNPVFSVFVGMTVIAGVLYPAAVTLAAKVLFSDQARGSVITENGKVIGSALIGQKFSRPEYFWGRPSGTGPVPYNGASGAGTNLAPSNPTLHERVAKDTARMIELHEGRSPVPVDLVTTSGSGLDPHISVAAAEYQIARVAKARGVSAEKIRDLVNQFTEKPTVGVLGQARVNVVLLNHALRNQR